VDLEGIAFSDDARKLLHAIAFNVPQERIDPQLIDFLNPPKQESYTQLWLSALSTPSDRLRNDPLASGTNLQHGQYIVIDQIGAGGQGIAYRARVNGAQPTASAIEATNAAASEADKTCEAGSIAVLKEFILPSHGGKTVRKRSLEDVEREAELLKQIANPHIVALKEFFVEDERAYLVLEHINGQSLRSLVQEKGPLDSAAFREISMQLCDILTHLHGQSIPVIHRDFTPENIMIGADNFTTLIDFNVAKQVQSTATKTVVGKHSYIPPEQFRGKATPQSDIYALGATMYFMLTGEDPEPISSSHPQEQNKTVSAAVDALVARATAIDTQTRYPDVTTLKSDLKELSSSTAGRSPAA
jgi:serine/threonine protein kinase